MTMLTISGYRFVPLSSLADLKNILTAKCQDHGLKGTILLAPEGININLSGLIQNIAAFKQFLTNHPLLTGMAFKESKSDALSFKRLKIKIKKEIITFRQPTVRPEEKRAPAIDPAVLRQWFDEKRPFTMLDTRNDYEVAAGTFETAINLKLKHFTDFPKAVLAHLPKAQQDKPIVMVCTGGIRCEKAALYMLQQGYNEVYQLEGGILSYFKEVGNDHYQGECFVFDERTSVAS